MIFGTELVFGKLLLNKCVTKTMKQQLEFWDIILVQEI